MQKKVLPASDFRALLSECGVDVGAISDTKRIDYLSGYVLQIGAKTAVIELNYIDKDFIEDYAAYYSRCFLPVERTCCRLHFFGKQFSLDEFEQFVIKGEDDLQGTYLGFVVIRGLSQKIIGRTCLRPYGGDAKRHFCALCRIPVCLFGLRLEVGCVPFQEQDSAVAACATCSLWSAFHISSVKFGHENLTPGKITQFATEHGLSCNRNFPNCGLTLVDIVYAIRHVGLSPIYLDVTKETTPLRLSVLLGNIRGYLNLGISVVVLGHVLNGDGSPQSRHAVAVSGFCLDESMGSTNVGLKAMNITKLYLHDDQIGPYARALVGASVPNADWTVEWTDGRGNVNRYGFQVMCLVVPIYHKIRVDYEQVWKCVFRLQSAIDAVGSCVAGLRLHWDILLRSCSDFKDVLREYDFLPKTAKIQYLEMCLPHYIWTVRLEVNGLLGGVFCIDATDGSQGLSVVASVFPSDFLKSVFDKLKSADAALMRNPLFKACVEAQFTGENQDGSRR